MSNDTVFAAYIRAAETRLVVLPFLYLPLSIYYRAISIVNSYLRFSVVSCS